MYINVKFAATVRLEIHMLTVSIIVTSAKKDSIWIKRGALPAKHVFQGNIAFICQDSARHVKLVGIAQMQGLKMNVNCAMQENQPIIK